MSGYTLSYRDKWQHPAFRNLLEAGIWSWMCDTAVWKKTKIRFNGILVELERGQLATSRRFISEGFGIGEQVTRTFLENLENQGMINQRVTRWGTVITICNYDKYQLNENTGNPPTNPQVTHDQPTGNPNKKELNTDNKINEDIESGFQEFWKLYPKDRAGSKEKAKAAYLKALTRATKEEINGAVEKYRTSSEVTRGYAKGAAAWLNDDRWTSDYRPDREVEKASAKQSIQDENWAIMTGKL